MRKVIALARGMAWRLAAQDGAIDDLLQRGLMVVAVLGVAAAVIGYYSGLNTWIGNKLTEFMNSH